jgi:ABC-type sugar transport system substrate-binding protein
MAGRCRRLWRNVADCLPAMPLMLGMILTGCHAHDRAHVDAALSAAPVRIAVVVSTLNNPWFVVLADTARDEAERRGYKVTVFDSQNDPTKESTAFDNLLAAGYQAVLLNATDANGSVANAQRARDAGVPVFTMDREINSRDAAVSQILSDNYAGAIELGEQFAEDLHSHGRYAELLGLVGDNNTWNRSRGFHSVVDRFPGLRLVAQQSAEFDRAKALDVMESILQAEPELDGVFCGNDAMALGAYQAVLAAGRAGKVRIYGFDGSLDALRAISVGQLGATALQQPRLMARTAAEYADRYLHGERGFPARVPVAVDLVTSGNVSKYLSREATGG